MRRLARATAPAVCALMMTSPMNAQRGANDWMTSANDAQRSSWVRSDAKISPTSLGKPGFEVVWKMKPDNTARQLNTLTPPSLLDFYIGYRGFRSLGFFGGSSDRVIGVDIDLAKVEWEKNFSSGRTPPGTPECPGGMTAAVTRPTNSAYPPAPLGRGGLGRGTPAKSGVGEPHEGAVTLKALANRPPQPVRPPAPKPVPGAPAAENPFAPRVQYALALSGDGKLHMLWVSNGNEPSPGIQFVPAGANAQGLISYGGVTYVSTLAGCPGIDSGVWALDMTTKTVAKWKAPGKGVVGTAGQAAGPDGTVFVSGGNGELTSLAARTLEVRATYKTGGAELTSSPVVFEFKGKDMVAVTSADGRLHVVDAANMSTAAATSEPFSGANFAAGALASWQDYDGVRWILAPASGSDEKKGSIVAFKVVEKGGGIGLEKGWTSRDLTSPLPPVIVSGVVFALSSGEFRGGDASMTSAQRAQKSSPAVLYALDGVTGKELWNSGSAIASFVHSGGLSAGGSRIYVAGYDGTQYAFSFPIEH